jgi:hypothetical protein
MDHGDSAIDLKEKAIDKTRQKHMHTIWLSETMASGERLGDVDSGEVQMSLEIHRQD